MSDSPTKPNGLKFVIRTKWSAAGNPAWRKSSPGAGEIRDKTSIENSSENHRKCVAGIIPRAFQLDNVARETPRERAKSASLPPRANAAPARKSATASGSDGSNNANDIDKLFVSFTSCDPATFVGLRMARSSPAQANVLQAVRGAFIMNGTTLTEWCRSNDVDPARAWRALQGKASGPAALKLRARILVASSRAAA